MSNHWLISQIWIRSTGVRVHWTLSNWKWSLQFPVTFPDCWESAALQVSQSRPTVLQVLQVRHEAPGISAIDRQLLNDLSYRSPARPASVCWGAFSLYYWYHPAELKSPRINTFLTKGRIITNPSAYGKCLIDQIDKNIRRCYENLWYQVFIPVLINAQYFNHFY